MLGSVGALGREAGRNGGCGWSRHGQDLCRGACHPRGLPLWLGERPEHIPGQVLMVPQVKMLPGRSYGVMGCNGLQFNQGGPH